MTQLKTVKNLPRDPHVGMQIICVWENDNGLWCNTFEYQGDERWLGYECGYNQEGENLDGFSCDYCPWLEDLGGIYNLRNVRFLVPK